MNKTDIENKVKEILSKEEHPLETAFNAEVANYEMTRLELKRLHNNNLNDILLVFKKRGVTNNPIARKIAERLATQPDTERVE